MKYSDTTEYPNIYKHIYWGNFNGCPSQSIIEARNKFIKNYQIVKHFSDTSKYRIHDFKADHQEFYEDILGRVVHLYSHHPNNGIVPSFKLITPIYNPYQITGIKIIETRKSKKILINTIYSKLPDDIVTIIKKF